MLKQADADVDFYAYDSDGPDGVPDSGDDDGVVAGLDGAGQLLQRLFRLFAWGDILNDPFQEFAFAGVNYAG